jgi:hypothetical protein
VGANAEGKGLSFPTIPSQSSGVFPYVCRTLVHAGGFCDPQREPHQLIEKEEVWMRKIILPVAVLALTLSTAGAMAQTGGASGTSGGAAAKSGSDATAPTAATKPMTKTKVTKTKKQKQM